jgi:hypothetical protein
MESIRVNFENIAFVANNPDLSTIIENFIKKHDNDTNRTRLRAFLYLLSSMTQILIEEFRYDQREELPRNLAVSLSERLFNDDGNREQTIRRWFLSYQVSSVNESPLNNIPREKTLNEFSEKLYGLSYKEFEKKCSNARFDTKNGEWVGVPYLTFSYKKTVSKKIFRAFRLRNKELRDYKVEIQYWSDRMTDGIVTWHWSNTINESKKLKGSAYFFDNKDGGKSLHFQLYNSNNVENTENKNQLKSFFLSFEKTDKLLRHEVFIGIALGVNSQVPYTIKSYPVLLLEESVYNRYENKKEIERLIGNYLSFRKELETPDKSIPDLKNLKKWHQNNIKEKNSSIELLSGKYHIHGYSSSLQQVRKDDFSIEEDKLTGKYIAKISFNNSKTKVNASFRKEEYIAEISIFRGMLYLVFEPVKSNNDIEKIEDKIFMFIPVIQDESKNEETSIQSQIKGLNALALFRSEMGERMVAAAFILTKIDNEDSTKKEEIVTTQTEQEEITPIEKLISHYVSPTNELSLKIFSELNLHKTLRAWSSEEFKQYQNMLDWEDFLVNNRFVLQLADNAKRENRDKIIQSKITFKRQGANIIATINGSVYDYEGKVTINGELLTVQLEEERRRSHIQLSMYLGIYHSSQPEQSLFFGKYMLSKIGNISYGNIVLKKVKTIKQQRQYEDTPDTLCSLGLRNFLIFNDPLSNVISPLENFDKNRKKNIFEFYYFNPYSDKKIRKALFVIWEDDSVELLFPLDKSRGGKPALLHYGNFKKHINSKYASVPLISSDNKARTLILLPSSAELLRKSSYKQVTAGLFNAGYRNDRVMAGVLILKKYKPEGEEQKELESLYNKLYRQEFLNEETNHNSSSDTEGIIEKWEKKIPFHIALELNNKNAIKLNQRNFDFMDDEEITRPEKKYITGVFRCYHLINNDIRKHKKQKVRCFNLQVQSDLSVQAETEDENIKYKYEGLTEYLAFERSKRIRLYSSKRGSAEAPTRVTLEFPDMLSLSHIKTYKNNETNSSKESIIYFGFVKARDLTIEIPLGHLIMIKCPEDQEKDFKFYSENLSTKEAFKKIGEYLDDDFLKLRLDKDNKLQKPEEAVELFFKGKLHKRNFFALYREDKTEEETN